MLEKILSRSPDVMSGELVFSETRVPVKNLFDYLSAGRSLEMFLEDFPTVRKESAVAVLDAARDALGANEVTA
ncbi:MAG: DUF433 domain-containing protein [Burkholderiaceae bacterium]